MTAGIYDLTNAKASGTFKFQYSLHRPVHPDPRFIPNKKKLSENIIGYFFVEFRKKHFGLNIQNLRLSEDDSSKKPDIYLSENDRERGVQITRLVFTRYEERKALAASKNKEFALAIAGLIKLPFPVIVNIFPSTKKDVIPLNEKRKGKSKIESELIKYIGQSLYTNLQKLATSDSPIWINVNDPRLSPHFRRIVLNKLPSRAFPNFPGTQNVYVNYDFNDVAYEEADIDTAINELYQKKNNGIADILLIWADDFELVTNKRSIAEKLCKKFFESSFEEIYFMTFENNMTMFLKSLEFWPLKCPPEFLSRIPSAK